MVKLGLVWLYPAVAECQQATNVLLLQQEYEKTT